MTTETTDFWQALQELRQISHRVLVALEQDDLDRVSQLADRSDLLLEEIKPEIEARSLSGDDELGEILGGLRRMNDRIVEILAEKREATRADLESSRVSRMNVTQYKSSGMRDPELLDVSS